MNRQNELNNFLFDGSPGAWVANLTRDHYLTAILDEMSEYIGSNVTWKWWSKPKDPTTFDRFNAQIETIDQAFFYLSIMIMKEYDNADGCNTPLTFSDYENYYIGTDRGANKAGVGLLVNTNSLVHSNFIGLFKEMCEDRKTVFDMIETLDLLVSSGGLNSELMSGLYVSKWVLNNYRWQFSDYEKVVNGVEDNTRIQPILDVWLNDKDQTLVDLKQSMVSEFFNIPNETP